MTADLAAFLLACLHADQQVARAALFHPDGGQAGDGEWRTGERPFDECEVTGIGMHIYDEGGHSPEQARHIALHDPAFVLADIAAKKEVIRIAGRMPGKIRPEYRSWAFLPSEGPDRIEQWTRDEDGELLQCVRIWNRDDYHREVCYTPESPILLALAQPYRGRPGWSDEWSV